MKTRMLLAMSVATIALGLATQARANGLNENGSFQFQDPAQRAVNNANLDLLERFRNGYYDSGLGSGYAGTTNYAQTVNCNSGSTGCGTSGAGATGSTNTSIGSYSSLSNTGGGSASLSATQTNSGAQTANPTPVGVTLPTSN